jgi:hypothetical protein
MGVLGRRLSAANAYLIVDQSTALPYIALMDRPLNEVAFTKAFLAQAKDEGMVEADFERLVQFLAANPEAGDLIQGSGGCRKVRVAGRGRGKSGGYRVVTVYAPPEMPVYVLAVLSKGSRENFTDGEVAMMAQVAKAIIAASRARAAS